MPAEDARGVMMSRVGQRTGGNLGREAQPARVQAVEKTRQDLALAVPLLQLKIEQRAEQIIEAHIVDYEAVELMSMDRNVARP